MRNPAIVSALLLAGCAPSPDMPEDLTFASAPAVSICQLMAHPEERVGQKVTVQGFYGLGPHERVMYDPACSNQFLQVQLSASSSDLELQRDGALTDEYARRRHGHFQPIPVIYTGTLNAVQVVQPCSAEDCSNYKLIESQLVSAKLN